MKSTEIQKLIKAYPRHYRRFRGEEIVTTLTELSDRSGGKLDFKTKLNLIVHGLQMRLGISSASLVGRSLNCAALPGMVMASSIGVCLYIFGDMHETFSLAHLGPNPTIGPLIYVSWIIGTGIALHWPLFRRSTAFSCVAISALLMIWGRSMQIAPNFWLVAIMVALGMPAVVAPSETLYRKRILANLLVGIVASVTLFAAISVENQFSNSDSIYLSGNYLLSTRLSVVDAVIVTISILLATFRLWAWLGAVLVLSGPFLFVAVVYPLRLSSNASEPKLAALSLAIWTIAALILLWKSTTGKKIGVMSLESLIDERLESTLSP